MAIDSRPVVLGIRIAQAIMAIIVMGTDGYVISIFNEYTGVVPSSLAFMIFNAVWTLLALVYLVLFTVRFANASVYHQYALLAIDAVTMIFWFAGFIALAVDITGCGDYDICESADAATAFGAFEWLLFAVTTAFAVMLVVRTHKSTGGVTHESAKAETEMTGTHQPGPEVV